ncbi:hypothetical protein AVEN_90056-1 [Araneus ventricosus]|uniref:Uncharacterized protein n=1 Tax=Araneus ventricosus TaxID=182803 RepID=A0A4Y1ZTS7_ARAVE|nr:hypothetical protein AVEN_90056-1 [Araneus ventricosus]
MDFPPELNFYSKNPIICYLAENNSSGLSKHLSSRENQADLIARYRDNPLTFAAASTARIDLWSINTTKRPEPNTLPDRAIGYLHISLPYTHFEWLLKLHWEIIR